MSEAYERMAARMPDWMDLREGSYAGDNLRAVAAELERMREMGIEYMPNRFFPTLASGEDLTLAAENFGVIRKGAAKAEVVLTLYGTAGTAFSGVKAAAGDTVFDAEAGEIGEDGSTEVRATAVKAGAAGNVSAGAVTELVAEYEGITSVENGGAAYGGADEETDAELRARVLERWMSPSTGGNRADYISWALAVPGVTEATAKAPGGGKVEVYIVADGLQKASDALVAEVYGNIEKRRPIGADVSVFAAEAVDVAVGVCFSVAEGYEKAQVLQKMAARMAEYIRSCCFKSDAVSYLKTAGILFAEGVADITDYTLNGARVSIPIGQTEFACLGEVTEI